MINEYDIMDSGYTYIFFFSIILGMRRVNEAPMQKLFFNPVSVARPPSVTGDILYT